MHDDDETIRDASSIDSCSCSATGTRSSCSNSSTTSLWISVMGLVVTEMLGDEVYQMLPGGGT